MDETRTHDVDAVVVGAGFAGLYMLYRLRNADFTVRVFEAGDSVGGTWYWNRYPGARCDVESMEYSYSFSEELQQEWEWTERYATQPEILRYLNHVADRFDLRPDIQLQTTVVSADYDEGSALWTVGLGDGSTVTARFVIMASGCLSQARVPSFPGLDAYRGRTYHTGDWPADGVDVSGLRVGIIGTGSSGVQVIPLVAQEAAATVVFQRTPNFTMPARNAPLTVEKIAAIKANYAKLREQARWSGNGTLRVNYDEPAATAPPELIQQRYEAGWAFGGNDIVGSFNDLTTDQRSNDTLAGFLRGKIRQIVRDSQTAQALTAQDYPVGAKRMCLGTDYYETFNRENVTARRPAQRADRGLHAARDPHLGGGIPAGRGHLRHGLRRHDWCDLARRYPRPRRAFAARRLGRRPAYVPGPGQRRFPQPLLHHRTGQPVGAEQRRRLDRAARRMDWRTHRVPAQARSDEYRAGT